jgi:hypothetical protein
MLVYTSDGAEVIWPKLTAAKKHAAITDSHIKITPVDGNIKILARCEYVAYSNVV